MNFLSELREYLVHVGKSTPHNQRHARITPAIARQLLIRTLERAEAKKTITALADTDQVLAGTAANARELLATDVAWVTLTGPDGEERDQRNSDPNVAHQSTSVLSDGLEADLQRRQACDTL